MLGKNALSGNLKLKRFIHKLFYQNETPEMFSKMSRDQLPIFERIKADNLMYQKREQILLAQNYFIKEQ